jgi:hypothetical protein
MVGRQGRWKELAMQRSAMAGLMAGVALAGLASAQEFRPDERYLKPGKSHNWTLTTNVLISAWKDTDENNMPVSDVWKFDSAAVVFPVIAGTASSRTDQSKATGLMRFDDRNPDTAFKILTGYPSGTQLGRWDLTQRQGRELSLQVDIPVTSWETTFDEAAASAVPWPTGAWPPAAQSAMLPEWYIDFGPDEQGSMRQFDMKPVDDLLRKWTGGKDPKSAPPVVLAKVLAGELVGHVQISGNGLNFNRLGQIEGISLQGVPVTAAKGQGSEFDAVCLLVAMYRKAGLPARVVVGYDAEDSSEDRVFEKTRNKKDALRTWAEFALFDESAKSLTWIPVDIARRRKESSRAPDWKKPWKFFGTHDELDSIIPFAFQFHPPTTVRAYGSPGFWGWLVMPEPPGRAQQALWFLAKTTPARADDQKKEREEKGKKK